MSHIESQVIAGQDGNVRKLKAAGWSVVAQHGGCEGWKDIDGRRCFVDYYGGVWAVGDAETGVATVADVFGPSWRKP